MSNGAEIRKALVACLAGHRRPIVELLQPNRKAIEDLLANHFAGMTDEPVELAELEATRMQIFERASTALTEHERRFLLSIKQGEPEWARLPFEGLDQWPAIQWKLHNDRQMSARSHKTTPSGGFFSWSSRLFFASTLERLRRIAREADSGLGEVVIRHVDAGLEYRLALLGIYVGRTQQSGIPSPA